MKLLFLIAVMLFVAERRSIGRGVGCVLDKYLPIVGVAEISRARTSD